MKGILTIVFSVMTLGIQGQSAVKGFGKLGFPEKLWAATHPVAAVKAWKCSRHALQVTDSLYRNEVLPGPLSGGPIDAFRHAYWMASTSAEIGPQKALGMARAHEKTNYRHFKNGEKEEEFIPDRAAMEMDLWNNSRGIELWADAPDATVPERVRRVLAALRAGELLKIRVSSRGEALDRNGDIIPRSAWEGKWLNARTLVPTGGL